MPSSSMGQVTPFSSTRHRLSARSLLHPGWMGGLSVGQGVRSTLLLSSGFVGFSAKARGFRVCPWEVCGGVAAPAGPAGPSPKVLCPWLPLAGPSSLRPSVLPSPLPDTGAAAAFSAA